VKIIGFDHNKDHVVEWATGLYADPEAAKYFAGVGVHWYGGLNTDKLEATHALEPSKFILATEACNCVGNVIFSSPNIAAWWTRAEKLALDILEDLRFWAIGWVDWNLLVDTSGGPNHLKNLCDANIVVDAEESLGTGSPLLKQASFYYMGQFSRYLAPGSKRVGLTNTVEIEIPPLAPADIKNGVALAFHTCEEESLVQRFVHGPGGSIIAQGTDAAPGSDGFGVGGECVEHCISGECWFPKVQLWACGSDDPKHGGSGNQQWLPREVKGGVQLVMQGGTTGIGMCLTAVAGAAGWAVGLDAGVTVTAAQVHPCIAAGAANQTFLLNGHRRHLEGGSVDGVAEGFSVRTADGRCLMPELEKLPHFDAVAFEQPDGSVSLVVMNTNDDEMPITVYDEVADLSVEHTVPAHAIHTYRYAPTSAQVAIKAVADDVPIVASGGLVALMSSTHPAASSAPAASAASAAQPELPGQSTMTPHAYGTASVTPLIPLVACVAVAAGLMAVRLSGRSTWARPSSASWEGEEASAEADDADDYSEYMALEAPRHAA